MAGSTAGDDMPIGGHLVSADGKPAASASLLLNPQDRGGKGSDGLIQPDKVWPGCAEQATMLIEKLLIAIPMSLAGKDLKPQLDLAARSEWPQAEDMSSEVFGS